MDSKPKAAMDRIHRMLKGEGVHTKEEAVELLIHLSFLAGMYAVELSCEHAKRVMADFDLRELEALVKTYEQPEESEAG